VRNLVAIACCLVAGPACLFLPAIDDDGYLPCASDADCGVGTTCAIEVGLCAPPPWHDEAFVERRALTVQNPSERTLAVGTAVPVIVGGDDGVLGLDDVPADARVADFDEAAQTWSVVGVFRDLFADRFTIWVPLRREVPPGGRAVLGYLEFNTEEGAPTILEEPQSTFSLFDDLTDFPDDEDGGDTYFISAPAAATPVVADSAVTVGDNVQVSWRQELVPPISVTFLARVNGLTCDEVFVGLTGRAAVGFNTPSAGFFVDDDLLTIAEVAPTEDSNPTPLSEPRIFSEQPNALHRFTIAVDGATARFSVDDVVFDERDDLRPAFADDAPLFPVVQVGGACSVDVEALWATGLPQTPPPTVTVGPAILFNSTFF